jgi:hypothetical protein
MDLPERCCEQGTMKPVETSQITLFDLINVTNARREECDPGFDGDKQKFRQRQKILRFFTKRTAVFFKGLVDRNQVHDFIESIRVELEGSLKAASVPKTTHTVHQSGDKTLIQPPQKSHNISLK